MVRIARFGALLLVAGLGVVLLVGCAGSGSDKAGGKPGLKVVVLTLANPLGGSLELDAFVGEVGRLSGGAIRIDVKSGWRSGQVAFENGLIGDVRAGKADLGVAGSRAWDSVGVTSLRALTAPLLIDSYALQELVLRSPLIPQMLKGLAPLGLVGLGVLPGPLRHPFGVARPLLGPSDYAGLRIGLQQSRVGSATLRALGATPVWFAAGGSIAGFGGVEQHISNIQGYQYDRVGRYLTANVVLWPRPLVVFANSSALAKLTLAQQRILRQAVVDADPAETRFVVGNERDDTASLCRSHRLRFLTATGADLVALRRAVQPVYDQLERDTRTRQQIGQIESMGRAVAPEAAPSCAQATPLAAKAGPLDGVYRFTSTIGDLRAAGAVAGDLVPENYGDWTIALKAGRFAFAQDDPQACTWAYGTLKVHGDTVELSVTDGGGIAPDGAASNPGELYTYKWSLYRDELTLSPVAGAVSPPPTRAKPWHRVSTTASMNVFDRRCPPPANALSG
jgi:TRAP-type C4-dicarboxylate transport system substrate-binding protein